MFSVPVVLLFKERYPTATAYEVSVLTKLSDPIATLKSASMLLNIALLPRATLCFPLLNLSAATPIAVFQNPVVSTRIASDPIAVLLKPVVRDCRALFPIAVFAPDRLFWSAKVPTAVLLFPS